MRNDSGHFLLFELYNLSGGSRSTRICIDPAVSTQVKLQKHKLRQGFAFSVPDVGVGGCRSQPNRQ
jgi:hypothetical protein